MKKTLINVLVFAAGAAIGSAVTWKVVKTKYERIAQEEIDSVKGIWARRMREKAAEDDSNEDDNWDEDDEEDEEFDDSVKVAYHTLAHKYSNSGNEAENDEEGAGDEDEEVPYINGPYVITPDEFANGNFKHALHCLTYYADGVLSNDWYEKLDIEETIGEESLEHFGDYAEDVVHVRNERTEADYEVVRDPRMYAEVIAGDPLMHVYAN